MPSQKPRVPQALVFATVAEHAPISPEQVAQRLHCHPATAKRNMDGLLAQGLLMLDDHDEEGRALRVPEYRYALTEAGEEALAAP